MSGYDKEGVGKDGSENRPVDSASPGSNEFTLQLKEDVVEKCAVWVDMVYSLVKGLGNGGGYDCALVNLLNLGDVSTIEGRGVDCTFLTIFNWAEAFGARAKARKI